MASRVEKETRPLLQKGEEMPKLILATVAWLYEPRPPRHDAPVHARARTREATRRLRAPRVHEPYVDLSCLDLTRTRH